MEVRTLTVAKCTQEEVDSVREYLQNLEQVVKENEEWYESPEINKAIADVARKYPDRAFLAPLNLQILLDNYQDIESDILEHPKWIKDALDLLEEIDKHLSSGKDSSIHNGSSLHKKIHEFISND